MKRFFAMFFSILFASVLAACGPDGSDNGDVDGQNSPPADTSASGVAELVLNGGFEDEALSFGIETAYVDAALARDCAGGAASGSCSLSLRASDSCTNPETYYKVQAKQTLELKVGAKCKLVFKTKSAAPRQFVVEVKSDISHTAADGMLWETISATADWQAKELSFTAKAVPSPTRLSFGVCGARAIVQLDDVSMKCE